MPRCSSVPAQAILAPPGEEWLLFALNTRALRKSYGLTPVLRGVELQVPEGVVYGLLGLNGSGKTTTLCCISGVLSPGSGRIGYFGDEVKRPKNRHKRLMGYVSQSNHMYPTLSGRQLGRFMRGLFPTWDHDRFNRLLRQFDVPPKRRVDALSGGTVVKLSLALALAHHPRLLVLDEPTSGLDPAARREFLEIVAHEAAEHGHTTLFSSHIVEEVERVAAHVGVLAGGVIAWQGRLAELKERAVFCDVPSVVQVPMNRLGSIRDVAGRTRPVALADQPVVATDRPSLEDVFLAIATGEVAA